MQQQLSCSWEQRIERKRILGHISAPPFEVHSGFAACRIKQPNGVLWLLPMLAVCHVVCHNRFYETTAAAGYLQQRGTTCSHPGGKGLLTPRPRCPGWDRPGDNHPPSTPCVQNLSQTQRVHAQTTRCATAPVSAQRVTPALPRHVCYLTPQIFSVTTSLMIGSSNLLS